MLRAVMLALLFKGGEVKSHNKDRADTAFLSVMAHHGDNYDYDQVGIMAWVGMVIV